MNQRNYGWPRFWYLRDGERPWIQNGLLSPTYDPDNTYDPNNTSVSHLPLFELTFLLDIPCLVLLGEPGMGKSHILDDIHQTLQGTNEDRYCFFNCAEFASPNELMHEIFDRNQDFEEWQTGNFNLHIFLDGFDETRDSVKSITQSLNRFLEKQQAALERFYQQGEAQISDKDNDGISVKIRTKFTRLRLRITCRTADWPLEFEERLKHFWGEDRVGVFVLAPLRQKDILVAAQQTGVDADLFWAEVVEQNVEIFASNPITFNFLLDEFRRTNSLPKERRELYERGCRELCRFKKEEKLTTKPEERFLIAARLAAFTIFTAHIGILHRNPANGDQKILTIKDCASAREQIGDLDFYLYETSVDETLNTGLFRGDAIRQWVHKTYAEFLATWYVVQKLDLSQIRDLIFQNGRLIPQLEETAAWIAGFKNEIFAEILASDPQVLLRSDVATGDIQAKSKLTLALLDSCQANPYLRYDRQRLKILKHKELAEILRTYLKDSSYNENVHEFAIEVAIECKERGAQDFLVEIALDPERSLHLRGDAAKGILEIGDQEFKNRLKPLALLPLDNRANGDLKRHGIRATWPHNLSAKELFESLVVPPERIGLIDYYAIENWRELILPDLKPDDLSYALQWVARQERSHNLVSTFAELLDAILLLGWQNLEHPGVLEEYTHTIVALWQRHDDVLDRHRRRGATQSEGGKLTKELVLAKNQRRLLLLEQLIPVAALCKEKVIWNFFLDIPQVSYDDIPWLVDKFSRVTDEDQKTLIASIIRRKVDEYNSKQFQYIYYVGEENPELWKVLDYQLYIELDSDKAKQAKKSYLQDLEHQLLEEQWEKEQSKPPLKPSPVERVRNELVKFDAGDIDAWWQMSRWMMVKPDGQYERLLEREVDFFNPPVWDELDETEKAKVIDTAGKYIEVYNPDAGVGDRWWEKRDWIFWPIVAGCRAFFALVTYDRIKQIAQVTWQKWAPALTYYVYVSLTFSNEESARKRKKTFLTLLKLFAPDEVVETILWIAECEDQEKHFFLASRLEGLWDKRLAQAILQEIREEKLSIANAGQLLSEISVFDFDLAEPLLKEWLITPIPTEPHPREKAVVAVQLLLQHAPDAGWSLVWSAIQQDNEFGVQVTHRIAGLERFNSSVFGKLIEAHLADFYLWLFNQFPPENDPKHEGAYWVTIEDQLADLRDSSLNHLVGRGTEQSVQQLKRIQNNLGIGLGRFIYQAEALTRQGAWQPISPQDFYALLQNKKSRWVQDETQLLDVVLELLNQLNEELQKGRHGATPAAIYLWNEYPHGKNPRIKPLFTPRDEERLSDYVEGYLKRELEGKNIFIGREVQIRRDNYPDIIVETKPVSDSNLFEDPLAVVIEVKGCWHDELKTAMREQLVGRYLAPHGRRHGIYLVGRFFCEKWSKEDDENRWGKSSKVDDRELQTFLENQAQELAKDGFDIRVHILDARLSD